jgi:hypothetical protein
MGHETQKGILISRANYPIQVKYGKDIIIVAPRGRTRLIEDISKLIITDNNISLKLIK